MLYYPGVGIFKNDAIFMAMFILMMILIAKVESLGLIFSWNADSAHSLLLL